MTSHSEAATKGTILVVDDTPDNLRVLSAILSDQGYDVRRVINGKLALRAAQASPPDLILLDIRMEGMDGYEVCQHLKENEHTREIPIIFLSALNDVFDKVKAFQVGGVDYITKPFQVEEVLVRVENQLTIRALQRQLHQQNVLLQQEIRERERAIALIQFQAQKEQALNQVIQSVRKSLDLTTVFSTATAEIGKLLRVAHVSIAQYHSAQRVWRVVAEYQQHPGATSILGLEVSDRRNQMMAQLKRQQVVRINDITGHKHAANALNAAQADAFPFAWLMVPLRVGDLVWGYIGLWHETHAQGWQDAEVELACAVADQVAIAIQQSELYQQVQQHTIDLEAQVLERTTQLKTALDLEALLKRITDRVRDSLDENQILEAVVQELALNLDVYGCRTSLYHLEDQTSTICHEHIDSTLPPANGVVVQMNSLPDAYTQLMQGECVQFCSAWLEPPLVHLKNNRLTILACCLQDDQTVLGDIWLFKSRHDCFNELENRLVHQVANQCAIALRQARLYQTAQQQVEELERLNQLKDDFLSNVSHELRTPVSNIKLVAEMLKINFQKIGLSEPESGKTDQYFQILFDECKKEIELINDLLDVTHLNAQTQPLTLTEINPSVWIASITEPFKELARNHQQILQVNISPELPCLATEQSYLMRILTELLNNACKYTPVGETITVSAQVEKGTSNFELRTSKFRHSQLPSLVISVSNSGIEISEQEQERIFDKFYRIPSKDPWRHGGTGLGLALVKKLVDCLGATIWVESVEGKTIFTVEFPIKPIRSTLSGQNPFFINQRDDLGQIPLTLDPEGL
ncbi:MAG: response regulator [Leptolyngbyaceae cyanobacterium RU_5_1]|nr:response regulator [Leptolyngbyaceae cyanobacterium RU_5_1]